MTDDRIAQLHRLLEAEPDDPFCLYSLGMEHAQRGEHDEALGWFDRVLAVDPAHHYAYYHRARTLEEAGRTDDALETAQTGLASARRDGDAKASSELEALVVELGGTPGT